MNKVVLMGRLTRDPDIRYSQSEKQTAIARYTLAVDRTFKREGEPTADFISCVAFGARAQFAEKYLRKGVKIAISGRIQTGRYTNREGATVYTTDVIVEDQEFAESKAVSDRSRSEFAAGYRGQAASAPEPSGAPADGFMNIPDSIDDGLPFN